MVQLSLQEFISTRVKMVDGITITKLCEFLDVSKPKFYRCMVEPFRFTDRELEIISEKLLLSEPEKKTLFAYKYGVSDKENNPQEKSENVQIGQSIQSLLKGIKDTDAISDARVFNLYRQDAGNAGVQRCSPQELAKMLEHHLKKSELTQGEKNPNDMLSFDIYLFNCVSRNAISALRGILRYMRKFECLFTDYAVTIRHFINNKEMSIEDEFRAFEGVHRLAALATSGIYTICYEDLSTLPMGSMDWCMIRYEDDQGCQRYVWLNFIPAGDVSVYSFTNPYLYSFLFDQYRHLVETRSANVPQKLTTLSIGDHIIKMNMVNQRLLIIPELCFDNICPELWSEVKIRYFDEANSAQLNKTIELIQQHADPGKSRSLDTIDEKTRFVNDLIDSFTIRYATSESAGAVNILPLHGLWDFVKNCDTSEIRPMHIEFSDDSVMKQLKNIRQRIGANAQANQQVYYCTRSSLSDTVFMVYRDEEIGIYFHEPGFSSVYWTLLKHKEISSEFIDYVTTKFISASDRGRYGSFLMSDEEFQHEIDKMIAVVQKRIDAGNASVE